MRPRFFGSSARVDTCMTPLPRTSCPTPSATILAGPHLSVLATTNPDGDPQTSVIFVTREGDDILFSTIKGRRKTTNMQRDPRVNLLVHRLPVGDTSPPYATISATVDLHRRPRRVLPPGDVQPPHGRRHPSARARRRASHRTDAARQGLYPAPLPGHPRGRVTHNHPAFGLGSAPRLPPHTRCTKLPARTMMGERQHGHTRRLRELWRSRPKKRATQPRPSRTSRLTERARLGKDARSRVPRSSHGEFNPAADRPDPVSLLEGQAVSRVPELVPIRYGRMLVSPFTFFRGAALIMASDLDSTPRSGLTTQVCGDAHLSNFGLFASPERALMFDVNDFDETLPGPWEWDVKRLAASAVIAARDREFTGKEAGTAALEVGSRLSHGDEPAGRHVDHGRLVLQDRRGRGARRPPGHGRDHRVQVRQVRWPSAPPRSSPRPAPGTASRRSTSSPRWSTASAASSATRP